MINRPDFPRVQSVELSSAALRANRPEQIIPFLGKNLQDLSIWTDASPENDTHDQTDSIWLHHVTTKCFQLTSLKVEVALGVSSTDLANLFMAMRQLQTLRLGSGLNAVLEQDTIKTILKLPYLKDLSLDQPLDSSFLDELLSMRDEILPQGTKLQIKLATNEDLSVGLLLSAMTKLQELAVIFKPAIPDQVVAPHASFLDVISTLPDLQALTISLSSTTQLTLSGISSLASHKKLSNFHILSSGRHFSAKPAQLSLTAQDIIHAPVTFKYLQMLDVVDIYSPIVATYDEVVQITHKIDNVSASYMSLFDLSCDEGVSFGWPSREDYEAFLDDTTPQYSIWKASLKAFAPDPVEWMPRDLKLHTNKQGGKIVPWDKLVTDGHYNYIG